MKTLIDFSSGNMMNFILAIGSDPVIFQTSYDRRTQLPVLQADEYLQA